MRSFWDSRSPWRIRWPCRCGPFCSTARPVQHNRDTGASRHYGKGLISSRHHDLSTHNPRRACLRRLTTVISASRIPPKKMADHAFVLEVLSAQGGGECVVGAPFKLQMRAQMHFVLEAHPGPHLLPSLLFCCIQCIGQYLRHDEVKSGTGNF